MWLTESAISRDKTKRFAQAQAEPGWQVVRFDTVLCKQQPRHLSKCALCVGGLWESLIRGMKVTIYSSASHTLHQGTEKIEGPAAESLWWLFDL